MVGIATHPAVLGDVARGVHRLGVRVLPAERDDHGVGTMPRGELEQSEVLAVPGERVAEAFAVRHRSECGEWDVEDETRFPRRFHLRFAFLVARVDVALGEVQQIAPLVQHRLVEIAGQFFRPQRREIGTVRELFQPVRRLLVAFRGSVESGAGFGRGAASRFVVGFPPRPLQLSLPFQS